MATKKKDTGTGILPGFEGFDFGEEVYDDNDEVNDEAEDQIEEVFVKEEDERTIRNKAMWDVLHECLRGLKLQWTDVARQLNVPLSTIHSRRQHGRDIEFGFMVTLLDMLGCTLRLYVPAPTGKRRRPPYNTNALTHALRGMLLMSNEEKKKTQTLLQFGEKTGTSAIADVFYKLSEEDKEMVYSLAVRLKNSKKRQDRKREKER